MGPIASRPGLGPPESPAGTTRRVVWVHPKRSPGLHPKKKLGPDNYESRDRTRGHTEGARASSDPLRKGAISFFVSDIYI